MFLNPYFLNALRRVITGDFRGLKILPHMQSLKVRIEWGHNFNYYYYSDIKMFICNIFQIFIIKRLIKGIHKTFLKHSIINGFHTHHFLTLAKHFHQKLFTGKGFILTRRLICFILLFGTYGNLVGGHLCDFIGLPLVQLEGPRWQSGNTLASHLCGRGSISVMAVSGKAGSCLPLVGSLQYKTLANYMYWFPLPFQLPVVI